VRGTWKGWTLVLSAVVVGLALVLGTGQVARRALWEFLLGTPLESPLRRLAGDLRSRGPESAARCEVKEPAARPVNIALIAVDTLRADHLGFLGYARDVSPRLDSLARDSIVFRRAISAASWTTPAFAGVFTGTHPGALGIEDVLVPVPHETPILAQILCEAGWQTAGVVSHSYVGVRYGFDRGFEQWDEGNAGGDWYVSSPNVTAKAIEYLDEFSEDPRPFFLFAHYFDPHYEYKEHAEHRFSEGHAGSYRSKADDIWELAAMAARGELDEAAVRSMVDSYDSEIAFTDQQIGELLDALERRGLYDDALIIFLSDHGELFVERPERFLGHGMHVYEALVHVPLVIKLPGRERIGRVEIPVSTVDVLPTILDIIGHPAPPASAPVERSLLRVDRATARPVFTQTRENGAFRDAVVEGDWKLIRDSVAESTELYDLSRDEGELDDLANLQPEIVARMGALLTRWQRGLEIQKQRIHASAPPKLTPEEKERLRGLGYVE
jgi:arylsulfatase A-like enzyme